MSTFTNARDQPFKSKVGFDFSSDLCHSIIIVDFSFFSSGKVNSIVLDSCKKTSIVLDSVVSSVEFVNCQSVQMQVLTKVPTISIDKTDGCQIYLNQASLDVSIVSAKSSEMNVLVPKADGDYVSRLFVRVSPFSNRRSNFSFFPTLG